MNCPRCAGTLNEVMVGLCRAHTCAGCGGAWVPFDSCEAVMPRLSELAPAGSPPSWPAEASKFKCPACGGDLVVVKAYEAGGVAVRTCMVCFGRWVDGSELCRTRGRGLMGMIRAALRCLAPKDKLPRNVPAQPAKPEPAPGLGSEESARTETPGPEAGQK